MEKRLNKRIFNEQFIIIDQIDKESFSNTKLIKNHILSNFSLDARYKDDQYWYMSEYVKIPYHQHIQWVQDWIRDHYKVDYNQACIPTYKDSIRGMVLQQGEGVITHNNLKEMDLEGSPDIDVIYTVGTGKADMVFEYDNGRDKHRRWKVPLQKDKFIICSSNLNRYITRNTDKDFLVNLSLHFQLL